MRLHWFVLQLGQAVIWRRLLLLPVRPLLSLLPQLLPPAAERMRTQSFSRKLPLALYCLVLSWRRLPLDR